jgi:hypothetical protein
MSKGQIAAARSCSSRPQVGIFEPIVVMIGRFIINLRDTGGLKANQLLDFGGQVVA